MADGTESNVGGGVGAVITPLGFDEEEEDEAEADDIWAGRGNGSLRLASTDRG